MGQLWRHKWTRQENVKMCYQLQLRVCLRRRGLRRLGRYAKRELADDDADDTAGDSQQRARASPHSSERAGGRACNHRHHLVQPLNHTEVRIPIHHSDGSDAAAATEGDDRRARSDDNDGCADDRDLREVMVYGGGRWRDGEEGGEARDSTIRREDNRRRRRGLGGMGRQRVGGVRRRRAEEEGWGAGECDAELQIGERGSAMRIGEMRRGATGGSWEKISSADACERILR
ncbi:hypothetical protein OsJ_13345 [Oryza sativa Japonica Group]|uniref:Uncharacterized protein n=1 Tax=Oryza sativa subsp. japonica TaxID=39947 RepID=B9F7K1_ORYSJ|nr:hypothetical protein OsJ_13345 [Oryza sativa Japonica Group]